MKRRTLGRWLLAFGTAAVFAVAFASWFVGGELVAPANCHVGPPPNGEAITSCTVECIGRGTIAAWQACKDDSLATIILLHGIRVDRRSMLGRAKLLTDAGYDVLMIDFQAHGETPGEHITAGYLERHDVKAAVDYIRRSNPTHRIGIVGWSLGGAATLLASPLQIDALVLESVYPTISEAVHDRIAIRLGPFSHVLSPLLLCQLKPRLGISPVHLRPIDHIGNVGCPVLVISGELDQHTTLAETRRLFEAAQEPKELAIFAGAAHVDLMTFDQTLYADKVLSFFDRYLRPTRGKLSAE